MKKIFPLILFFILGLANAAEARILHGGAPTPVVGCSFTPPLDVKTGVAGFSFRVLSTSWIGQNIVTIQRSSDSTQKTFTASAPTCEINQSDAFFDGSTYTIVTWYDQSGNGVNVTQATNANRPTVLLNCQNGHPCAVFNGTSQFMSGTMASGVSNDTFAAVANSFDNSSGRYIAQIGITDTNQTSINFSLSSTACVSLRWAASVPAKGTKACSTNTWYRWVGTQTNTLSSIYLNGVKGTDDTTSLTLSSQTALNIGEQGTGASWWDGDISEVLIFAPSLSSTDSGTISSNQGSFWGI